MPKFEENINLSQYSSYRMGGAARFFFSAATPEDISWAVREAKKMGLDVFILGGGTNLLISENGWSGLILKPDLHFIERDGDIVRVGAGVQVSELLDYLITNRLSGLEWAGGLPGMVGGAVRGNAGAFGGEAKDLITEVESFDIGKGELLKRKNGDCGFAYRSSVFKEAGGKEIILAASFKLKNGNKSEIRSAINEKIEYRKNRQPLEYPNIGSIFQNVALTRIYPEGTRDYKEAVSKKAFDFRGSEMLVKVDPFPVVPTARLISGAGLKGVSFGGAMISPKHANFIVNVLSANASDVSELIKLTKAEVKNKFGVDLEEEVQRVGDF